MHIIRAALSHSTLHFLKLPLTQTVELTSFTYGGFLTLDSSKNILVVHQLCFPVSL